jgi:hypothetical protein
LNPSTREDCNFDANLSCIVTPCIKKKKRKKEERKEREKEKKERRKE